MIAWPNLWCHSQLASMTLVSIAIRHWPYCIGRSSRSIMQMFPCLCPMSIISLSSSLETMHIDDSKITLNFLSQNWLILSKLCFKPSTSKTFSMKEEGVILILPLLIIFPFPLSSKVTFPPSIVSRDVNYFCCPEWQPKRGVNWVLQKFLDL